jgi:hypothetical protein
MLKKVGALLKSLMSNQWTITLFATMAGVFMAILLEGYISDKRLEKGKLKALAEIEKEMKENEEDLLDYNALLKEKLVSVKYVTNKLNDDLELLVAEEEIPEFRSKTQSFIIIEDSVEVTPGVYKYSGEMNFQINSRLIIGPLLNVSWKSYKQTQYMTITEFTCLSEIELIYNVQDQVDQLNKEWGKIFFKGDYISNLKDRKEFLTIWKNLLMHQDILLDLYKNRSEMLEGCK